MQFVVQDIQHMAQTKRPSMLFRFSRGEVIYMHTPIKYSQWLLPQCTNPQCTRHSAENHMAMCLSHFYSWSCRLVMWGQMSKNEIFWTKSATLRSSLLRIIKQNSDIAATCYVCCYVCCWCVPPSMCLKLFTPCCCQLPVFGMCMCVYLGFNARPDQTIYESSKTIEHDCSRSECNDGHVNTCIVAESMHTEVT